MTAEAGECNGRSEGSKAEFEGKRGGDLKEGGIACRDAEEIGGSFVIVNGDSDDHSDRDLDSEGKLDPKSDEENGGSRSEDEVIGGKAEPLVDDGMQENGNLAEERSNGEYIEKDEGDAIEVQEEQNAMGSGSDIKVEEESVNGVGLDSVAEIEREEVEADEVKVEESDKAEVLTCGSEFGIEHEGGGSEVPAVVEEREAEVVIAEEEGEPKLETEVESKDTKEPETAVLEKSESAAGLREEEQPVSPAAKADENVDVEPIVAGESQDPVESAAGMREEEQPVSLTVEADENVDVESSVAGQCQDPVDGVGETEIVAVLEPLIEAEPRDEARNVVEENGDVSELEPAVEVEVKEEPVNGIEETENQLEVGSAVKVESEQVPDNEIEDSEKLAEAGSVGEEESGQKPDSGIEEVTSAKEVTEVRSAVDIESEQEEAVSGIEEAKEVTEVRSAVNIESEQEPNNGIEEPEKLAEAGSVGEEESGHKPDTGIKEAKEVTEVRSTVDIESEQEDAGSVGEEEYGQKPDSGIEGAKEVTEVRSAVDIESEQELNDGIGETDKLAEVGSGVHEEKPDDEIEAAGKLAEVESAAEGESEQNPGSEETEELAEATSPVEVEPKPEPNNQVEEIERSAEGSTIESEPKEHPDTVMEEMERSKVEEEEQSMVAVEENYNQVRTTSIVDAEPQQEAEPVLEAADKIEAEERKEPEDAVAVDSATECFAFENGIGGESNASDDTPTHQLENGSKDSITETSDDSSKDVSNGEARGVTLEHSDSLDSCHISDKEVVEEVSYSADNKHVELDVSNGDAVAYEPKADISSEDVYPDLSTPVKDTGTETNDSVEVVKTNKDAPLDGLMSEAVNRSESAEGNECRVSPVERDQSANSHVNGEPSLKQAQASEATQAPPETHVVRRQEVYMIKVPRFIDDKLQKEIQDAQVEMQKKTEDRDSKGRDTRKQAEEVKKFYEDYQAELAKEKDAREKFNAKRKEIDNIQQTINRINNANSIADIDEKIRNMIHRQQHETISLKQEKQYIHDINQMKRLREQLSSKKPSQEEIDEAFSQRDEVEARFKNLKKELDLLRAALMSAESSRKSAWVKYKDQEKHLKNLKEEHNAAGGVRQEAYLHWRKLISQSAEKEKHFRMYKADRSAATTYIFSADNQGLLSHCSRQVERFMDVWNSNAEFREQYVKSNMYRTLDRLGTPDGRALGPGESPPILRFHVDRSSKPAVPPSKRETQAPVLASEVKQGNLTEPSATKRAAEANHLATLRSSAKPVVEGGASTVSNSEKANEEEKEKILKQEQEEQARKAEELARKEEELRKERVAKEEQLRKEKAATELKEKLRLEQKAKAKEAEERKRRKAEKAQAKAEFRAQKEAELKEKKKAKKGNKKSSKADTSNGGTEDESTLVTDTNPPETPQEPEASAGTVSKKRSSRPVSSVRQYNKVQAPVPPPLRNRGKRRMRTLMWGLLAVLLVLILFFAGNYISFSTPSLPDFGF